MGKVIIEFNMPDEKYDYQQCVIAPMMYNCLTDIMEQTRSHLKHGHTFKKPYDVLRWIRETIVEHFNLDNVGE